MTIIPEEVIFYFIYSFFDFGKIVVLYAQEFQGWHEKPDPKNPLNTQKSVLFALF